MTRRRPTSARRDRAFTLLEAVIVVVVIALAVPTGMRMLSEAEEARRNAADTTAAATLAATVLEQIMADVHSSESSLGFDALADASAYLTTSTTGLYDRLDWAETPYTAAGMTYAVTIGALADSSGTVTGDADEDVFRRITVTVTFDDPDGGSLNMPVSMVVTDFGS